MMIPLYDRFLGLVISDDAIALDNDIESSNAWLAP